MSAPSTKKHVLTWVHSGHAGSISADFPTNAIHGSKDPQKVTKTNEQNTTKQRKDQVQVPKITVIPNPDA